MSPYLPREIWILTNFELIHLTINTENLCLGCDMGV